MAKPREIPEVPQAERAQALLQAAHRTFEAEAEGIAALSQALTGELGSAFVSAIELLRQARGRVIVTGMGKSGHIARKIAGTLASTGTPAFFVHPGEASHGDLGMITGDDVIIALSWSGETSELKDIIEYCGRFRIVLIAITANADSALARAADVVLSLPEAREACPHVLAPTTSSLMQLVLGDAIAVALLESRGFTALRFRMLHPGGRLGAMLKLVRDVMHVGEALPLARTGTRLADALPEMSRKAADYVVGCVGIVDHEDRLVGIITDGDLRRKLRPDLLDLPVEAVMSRQPKTVQPDQMVSEALELINALKVSVLIVVEDERPVGIVHFHHLLKAGVA